MRFHIRGHWTSIEDRGFLSQYLYDCISESTMATPPSSAEILGYVEFEKDKNGNAGYYQFVSCWLLQYFDRKVELGQVFEHCGVLICPLIYDPM